MDDNLTFHNVDIFLASMADKITKFFQRFSSYLSQIWNHALLS